MVLLMITFVDIQVKQEAQGLLGQLALQETLASQVHALPLHIIFDMHLHCPQLLQGFALELQSTR